MKFSSPLRIMYAKGLIWPMWSPIPSYFSSSVENELTIEFPASFCRLELRSPDNFIITEGCIFVWEDFGELFVDQILGNVFAIGSNAIMAKSSFEPGLQCCKLPLVVPSLGNPAGILSVGVILPWFNFIHKSTPIEGWFL